MGKRAGAKNCKGEGEEEGSAAGDVGGYGGDIPRNLGSTAKQTPLSDILSRLSTALADQLQGLTCTNPDQIRGFQSP